MILAHISDLHVAAAQPARALRRSDTNARVRALIRHLAGYRTKIDLVLISGDLTEAGTVEDFAILRELLDELPMPFVLVPGNHDQRRNLRMTFPDLPFEDPELLNYEYRTPELRVLALDSLVPGAPQGRLGPRDLSWLEGKLQQHFDGTTCVMLHHPPCPTRMGLADQATLTTGTDQLFALLNCQSKPVMVLCGHMHRPYEAQCGQIRVYGASSPAFEFEFVADASTEPDVANTPYSYQLHFLTAPGQHVVHRILPEL